MNAPSHPYDLIAAELRTFAEQEGPDLWRNRIRLTGLLLDHQPDLRREIRAVVSGVEQGVADALKDTERSLSAIAIDRQASQLETESGLRPEIALNVTRTIAHALNLGPLPSVYGHAGPPPTPPVSLDRPMPTPTPQPMGQPMHQPMARPVNEPMAQAASMPPHQGGPPPQQWSDPRHSQRTSVPTSGGSRFPWAVVILGSATLAAAGIVTASLMSGGGQGGGGTAAAGPAAFSTGQWEYVTKVVDAEAVGAPAELATQVRGMIGTEQTTSECVADASTNNMAQQLSAQLSASLGEGGTCNLSRQTFANGTIDIAGSCSGANGNLDLTANGSFTTDTSTVDMKTTAMRAGQQIKMDFTVAGRRLGACTP